MKSLFFTLFIFLQIGAYAQISFEEVAAPNDFNLRAIRKSPTGEYFVQAVNDASSIYTSMNGQDWTRTDLPEAQILDRIRFFSDGTPIMQTEREPNLIRRNGAWFSMNFTGGWKDIEASFIKDDSLFIYQDNTFAYSLDKGQSFNTIFTYGGTIIDHSANLWKINDHFILHHTAGASDMVSIFNRAGERLLHQELNLSVPIFLSTDCGEVLFYDRDTYYLIKDDGLTIESGNAVEIYPEFSFYSRFHSQAGHYYLKEGNKIYKSPCGSFNWTLVLEDDLIETGTEIWITSEEDIFAYTLRDDHYQEYAQGANQWEERSLEIDYAFLLQLDEAEQQQFAITSNALFQKRSSEPDWTELPDEIIGDYQIGYAPDGGLYVSTGSEILYSQDNGNSFTTIEYPNAGIPFSSRYNLTVLDNDILVLAEAIGIGNSFYSLNGGVDWTVINSVASPFSGDALLIRLVNNHLFLVNLVYGREITRIDISTNEAVTEELVDFYDFSDISSAIMGDGTIYFYAVDITGTGNEGVFRYRFGEPAEYVGPLPGAGQFFSTSADELFIFGDNSYYEFDGVAFIEQSYSGLPTGIKRFFLSTSEHLYAVIGKNRIFRSTQTLAEKQQIIGSVYHDENLDCLPDPSDNKLKYWKVKVENNDHIQIRTTNRDGDFKLSVPQGDYTLSCQPVNGNWELCEPSYAISVNTTGAIVKQDFQAKALRDCSVLELDFSTPFLRRCFDNYYTVLVRNTGPSPTTATKLTLELDPFFDFTDASIPFTQLDSITYEFDLGILEVGDQISFRIFFNLSCDADLSMEHCLSGRLDDANLCGEALRSSYVECQENIGSFDPNDKRIFDKQGLEVSTIDKDEYIYYHIRFQNTGTDTAFNIEIIDPLSPILDLNTFEMLSASHLYEYTITDGPDLVVNFNDILLPDSTTNEVASNGFFKFRIKPLPDYDYGTMIPNQAAIYFDFNEAINTNEAILVIDRTVALNPLAEAIEFGLFPNPVQDLLHIEISAKDLDQISSFEVVNELGQSMDHMAKTSKDLVFRTAGLAPGIYFFLLKENGVIVGSKKFVKVN